jgi:hypothetical protein
MLFMFVVLLFFSLAFLPFQQEEVMNWRGILETVIVVVVMLLGAPFTQYLKNALKVKDKLALLLTGIVAVALAFGEMYLSGILNMSAFTLENFPLAFTSIFTVATIYYNLLKGTDSVLGTKLLLPSSEPDHDVPG